MKTAGNPKQIESWKPRTCHDGSAVRCGMKPRRAFRDADGVRRSNADHDNASQQRMFCWPSNSASHRVTSMMVQCHSEDVRDYAEEHRLFVAKMFSTHTCLSLRMTNVGAVPADC